MANYSLKTSALNLADFTASPVWQKNIKSGVLAGLAASEPEIKVGSTDFFAFTGTPKAELVGEGANKSSMENVPAKVVAKTYKVQLTYRYSDELKYADEEYQLGVVRALAGNIATGISRALDLIAIHGVNPLTGSAASSVINYFKKSNNNVSVITSVDPVTDLDAAAAALQGNGYGANGIAMDPVFAGQLARVKDTNGRQMYPELGFGFGFDSFQGLKAVSADTISGKNEISYTTGGKKPVAIMGDFDAFKWGIAKEVPLHLIEYGDPDGLGDLQRTNEVAIRAEAYIGFAIMDGKAFAMVEETVA